MYKKAALLVFCCAFLLLTVAAHADLDPTLSMGDPACSSSPIPTVAETGVFFRTPINGGGVFAICNVSGSIWHSFDVVTQLKPGVVDASTVVCNVTGNPAPFGPDRKSTRLNSSHVSISY